MIGERHRPGPAWSRCLAAALAGDVARACPPPVEWPIWMAFLSQDVRRQPRRRRRSGPCRVRRRPGSNGHARAVMCDDPKPWLRKKASIRIQSSELEASRGEDIGCAFFGPQSLVEDVDAVFCGSKHIGFLLALRVRAVERIGSLGIGKLTYFVPNFRAEVAISIARPPAGHGACTALTCFQIVSGFPVDLAGGLPIVTATGADEAAACNPSILTPPIGAPIAYGVSSRGPLVLSYTRWLAEPTRRGAVRAEPRWRLLAQMVLAGAADNLAHSAFAGQFRHHFS